jgi:hypothetical protein
LNAVLFPGGLLPLRIFEQRYMDMATACIKKDEPFGVCLIRSGREVGAPATPEPIGCTARIIEWDMQHLGLLSIKTRGEQRFNIQEAWVTDAGLTRARVALLPPDEDAEIEDKFSACTTLLRAVIDQHGANLVAEPIQFDSVSWVSSRLTEILPVPLMAKQKLLELHDARQRIEILDKFLQQNKLST